MPSPLSPAQLELLRRAMCSDGVAAAEGDAANLAVLERAGLVRDAGGGRHVVTDAGRRYANSVFGDDRDG